jgi:hypothetical protein
MSDPTIQQKIETLLPFLEGTTCLYHEIGMLVEARVRHVDVQSDRFRIELQAVRFLLNVRGQELPEWKCGAAWPYAGHVSGMLWCQYIPWTLIYDPAWMQEIVTWSADPARLQSASWDADLVVIINRLAKQRHREESASSPRRQRPE